MPEIGMKRRGREIGKNPASHIFVWLACEDCGKERWVDIYKGNPLCLKCAHKGTRNGRWKNGKSERPDGYLSVCLDSTDFFYPMANPRGRVLEHRLVMARHLGRCLNVSEVVHHKNGDRRDNHLSNLEILSQSEHMKKHMGGADLGSQG